MAVAIGAVLIWVHDRLLCGVAGWRLIGGMQRIEERDECRHLRWVQVLAVSRHVAAALHHLADELVVRHAHRDAIQVRATQTT